MHRGVSSLGRLSALLALGSVALSAQGAQTGTVSGTVRSEAGKPITGATVSLKTGQGDRVAQTDAGGNFRFPQLTPGNAKLVVSANGFVGASAEIRIHVDKSTVTDMALKTVQEAGTTVVVTASGEGGVDTTDAKAGKNFSLDSINALPINGRNIATIASLSPGTSNDGNGLTIRGAQSTQVQYLVDGADVMDPVTGGSAVRLNEEFLEEVQVQTGAISAEYGRFTGGVVNTVTKSGTNDFKGVARFDVTNSAWNAYNPLSRGASGTNTFKNAHNVVQQYVVSGPILKDKLFFAAGYRTTSPQNSAPGTTTSSAFGGVGFATTTFEERKDLKIDWQITPSHKVFWQWNKSVVQSKNIDYPSQFGLQSTSLETLSAQADLFQYVTFGYLGQLSGNLLLDVRLNHKKETLGGTAAASGGQGRKNAPLWIDIKSGDVFDNGFFSNDGDSRPVRTANASLTWFVEAMGSHEVKGGYQGFESRRNSANAQTPSNYIINFFGFAAPGDSSVSNRVLQANTPARGSLDWYEPIFGATTKNTIHSLYVNDKWKLNPHWAFNLGLRYDKFQSKDDLGRDNFTFKDLSPRLAAIYDVDGQGTHVISMNYGVYVGQVIQGASDASSPAGNPIYRSYVYLGGSALLADGSLNRAAFSSTPYFVNDPFGARNTSIDPNLKSPRMRELSVDYKHSDGRGGTWSLNLVRRVWDRFVDDFYEGNATTETAAVRIRNDDSIKRDYTGLELQYQKKVNEAFSWGLQATLSSLRGNFEGGQVGTQDQRNNFGAANTIPVNQLSPTGYLAADRPLAVIANAGYRTNLGKGHLGLGLLAYYTAGAPYSLIGASTPAPSSLDHQGYGSTYTRYFGERGALRFPDTHQVDLQVSYDIPVWNKVVAFARVNVQNLFNHQVLRSWNTNGTTDTSTGTTGEGHDAGNIWKADPGYGRPSSSTNYLTARTINVAAGVRF